MKNLSIKAIFALAMLAGFTQANAWEPGWCGQISCGSGGGPQFGGCSTFRIDMDGDGVDDETMVCCPDSFGCIIM